MFALFVPALVGALAAAMGSFVGRALIALGVGFVSYKGIDLGLNSLRDLAISNVKGMPVQVVGFLAYLWVDKALTVIFSGVAVALSMRMIGGSVKKMVIK